MTEGAKIWLVVLTLIVAVLCAYAQVGQADFIHYDDDSHVFKNPVVTAGLTGASFVEAFKPHASLWVPLTTISFQADVSLFGLHPGAMHIVNLLWHTATMVLLFLTLRRMTGNFWASAFVAALFGLHPLNVESVAWVTERKNVLCAFFWIATIAMYSRYVEKSRVATYVGALVAAALALMSKPMAVTLPFTLLLLDAWPLRRMGTVPWSRLLLEKVPFFALAIAASLVAMSARREAAVVTLETVSLAGRMSNALVSYAIYLWQMVWPADLGVFYPHPINPQPLLAALAGALLITISAAALVLRKRCPYFLVGWLWFLGTLVPMIGLVQVGSQARADRFTYIPQLGVFIAFAWMVAEFRPKPSRLLVAPAVLLLILLGLVTSHQVAYWTDGATLFEHTISVTKDNACAYTNAGLHRSREGDYPKAIEHLKTSLRILPDQSVVWRELGQILLREGKAMEAAAAFGAGLKQEPEDIEARYGFAVALRQSGANAEAIRISKELLERIPNSSGLRYNLGLALEQEGKREEARAQIAEAARLAPNDPKPKEALARMDR